MGDACCGDAQAIAHVLMQERVLAHNFMPVAQLIAHKMGVSENWGYLIMGSV